MGVPGLFSHLRKYNKRNDTQSTIKSQLPNPSEPIHLYLDFNGAIYQALKPEIKTDDTFILHILEYLDNLVNLFDTENVFMSDNLLSEQEKGRVTKLFIAIDGVPPRAKMEQQRQRRFHSICRKQKTAAIDAKYGDKYDQSKQNTHIDTNMITPGTVFMDKLRIAIRQHIGSQPQYKSMDVIFNDWSNPGEGEHKIFQHMAEYPPPDSGVKNIVYGLDGDLIMLSLASQINNIYLIREAYEYGQYSFEHEGYPYLFLDVDCLKTSLVVETARKRSTSTQHMPAEHVKRFIDDYVVLMMLLGNDFMPKIHWIGIKNNGHEILLSQYFQVQNGICGGLDTDEGWLFNRETALLNVGFLQELFARLARQEDKLARGFVEDRAKKHIPIPAKCSERERQQIMTDFLPMQYLNVEAGIRIGEPKWRSRYYYTCLDMPGTPENIQLCAEAYIRTLIWNASYYVGRCASWDWFYPYDYAPTLADVYYFIRDFKTFGARFRWPETAPIQPQVLLFMVLPVNSSELMAREVRNQLLARNDPQLAIYFPESYAINLAFHSKYYECSPKIPRMPINYAQEFVKTAGLTPSELERNAPAGVDIWPLSNTSS